MCAAVLFGPLQATSYLLNHGLLAATLSSLWTLHAPVFLLMPACAAVRVLGQAGSLVVTSWALRENLFALIVNNLYALLVRRRSADVSAAGGRLHAAWHQAF